METRNARFAATLVDALARLGVEHACVSPGSRNTPLSLALADSSITDWSHHDERSSGFFALGIARTTGSPVAIVTTSGTATTELHPALAEAKEGRVPLIALTADRPAELVGVGAPQTIDQRGLYGPSVKWTHDVEVGDPDSVAPEFIVSLAARAYTEATAGPPGPIHLNVRFREPLFSESSPGPFPTEVPEVKAGLVEPDEKAIRQIAEIISGRRGVLIAGPQDDPKAAAAASSLAAACGWPIVADPLSGLRSGAHDLSHVLQASDPLGWAGHLERLAPEIVVRFGAIPTSKPWWQWLQAHPETPQVFIEPYGWRDPMGSASHAVRSDPAATLDALAKAVTEKTPDPWLGSWRAADVAASAAVDHSISDAPFPNEPTILRTVVGAMSSGSVLWVASSMPVRDLDAVMPVTPAAVRVMANRGANGIDGFVSSALGSTASSGLPTVAVAGDLSVLHDLNALATAQRMNTPLTLVVVHNDGGGIFHLLPQAGHQHFERHFGTPHGLDFVAVASAIGIESAEITERDVLANAVANPGDGPRLLQLRTDREDNAALHREIQKAVKAALAD